MISLRDYIKRRNGVSMGHSKSLTNMLKRSLGATSFDMFWVHWNPIWNYYLNRYICKPLKNILNQYAAIILTFGVSGLIHDLVGLLINKKLTLFFTLWFMIMGGIVVLSKYKNLQYSKRYIVARYVINITLILGSFYCARFLIRYAY